MMLPPTFFNRPTLTVARELLGQRLCRRIGSKTVTGIITETEAYHGPHDLASHASRGRTPRTEVMFGPAGTIYVYLIYGMHWCLNIVTGPVDYPAAVLIRGLIVDGLPTTATNGPGKVCRVLRINGELNTQPLVRTSGLWIDRVGISVPRGRIKKTPRIGVDYAKSYRDKPWRFVWSKPSSSPL